jgi:hypothetical protein
MRHWQGPGCRRWHDATATNADGNLSIKHPFDSTLATREGCTLRRLRRI